MDDVTDTVEPAIRHAIEVLVQEHAWLIDHGQARRVTDLFAEDGRLLGIGPDKVGRAAIADWAGQREDMQDRRSRHVQTNLRLERRPDGRVGGTVVLTLYRHDGPGAGSAAPLLVAEYQDIYQRGPDGVWRFAERRLSVLFGG